MEEAEKSLIVMPQLTPLEIFKSGDIVSKIVDELEKRATEIACDADTPEGRATLKQLKKDLNASKNYLDGVGKDLVAELKALPNLIDGNRKTMRDRIDALRDRLLEPLEKYEAAEKKRNEEAAAAKAAEAAKVAAIQDAINAIVHAPIDVIGQPASAIRAKLEELQAAQPDVETFGDRTEEATTRWKTTVEKLLHMAEQAEAVEQAERHRIERETADRVREQERQRAEQAARDSEQRIAREAAERAQAEARAQAAEQSAAAAREAAAAAKANADAQAQQQADQAAARATEAERQRQAAEQRQAEEAAAARAANIAHRKKINGDAVNAVMLHATDADGKGLACEPLNLLQARAIIVAINKGLIPNVTISY